MRAISVSLLILASVCVPSYAFEIVIKDAATEKKPEEVKPEPPTLPNVTVSVINRTKLDMLVAVQVSEMDSKTHVMLVQNTVAKEQNLTLGKYFSPLADATFKLQEYSVIFTFGSFPSQKLECSFELDASATSDIKKSIIVYLHTPPDDLWPRCLIYFDK